MVNDKQAVEWEQNRRATKFSASLMVLEGEPLTKGGRDSETLTNTAIKSDLQGPHCETDLGEWT